MSASQPLTGSIAASTVLKWLRAWHADGMPDAVDLEVVRQMLPETPYGKGVREIKAPMVLDINSCEGMLVRNPQDTAEWGIFYNGKANPERQRFTIAHELGHYFLDGHIDHVLPNDGVHASHAGFSSSDPYEQEADNFAAGLLMPSSHLGS